MNWPRLTRKTLLWSLAAIALAAASYVGLVVFVTGATPREYIASWIYPEVGFLERDFQPEGRAIEFQNQILAKRFYSLDFVVHTTRENFDVARDKMQRIPFGDQGVCGEPSIFNIVVRNSTGNILYNKTVTAYGATFHGPTDIGREIVALVFDPGVYDIAVTPVGDFSKFKTFSTSFSLYFRTRPKTAPIFSDDPAAMKESRPVSAC